MSGLRGETAEVEMTLDVTRREVLTPEVVLLELSHPMGEALPEWAPGAHVDLVLPDAVTRQYSLCGDPANRSTYRVAVFLEPQSRGGSSYIHHSLRTGDQLGIRGPRNHFKFVPGKKVLFIAGGIGITPLIPMMAAATDAGIEWELHYGGRSRNTMAFRDELAARFGDHRTTFIPQDEAGLIDLAALLGSPDPDTVVYCCGPEPLLDAVEAKCATWPKGALHIERFTAKAVVGAQNEAFEVELAVTGDVLSIPADRSILDVLDDHDVPVASSCRDGTCGSCETVVLNGQPDHRDSVLSEEEQASNETMLVCVSRSRSARLVLEL
ncbi:ferredoxin (plasmid) [Mycolicibacterium madagascariense]|uniref:Ferredoxin n=1 Tax=Mycolicibacterium madagascariense TaxID=212765 RepID=A0A7I7XPU9_9MYCO|nr:PDR/VanB family oxidoreductase [Mycolicibacterium madagascariense]BBZ31240.1 ferredoxin [Mycolicibacterium madagascariense]